ncbi:MAG: Uma2 family endonuclease [Oscillatoriales cyanobacterium RU_3_3]|nr:Uma2 family endonuclease [Oscillatoriales cyanobacterium RU_3_3]NJR25218.1 Uma2 family endonuclease [Richelia sp. CSU_2_1]
MISPELKSSLPSTEDLPCSDDTPVDNEDQNLLPNLLLPNLLLFVLTGIWSDRLDWYFGVDMAVYHTTGISPKVPVVPDGFLSLGVERRKGGKSRRSYAVWEENEIVPILVLEMVSHKPGGEYDEKMSIYAKLGVLYYIIYNPEFWRRDRHQPFEVYKLIDRQYLQQIGEPYWMAEVGLGIGRSLQLIGGIEQESLVWYDESGNVYPLPDTAVQQMREELRVERQRAERLAEYLRSQGIDPDNLPEA